MITITAVWLYLITVVVYGTIIIVNNNGNDSVGCCSGNETCPCSSLSSALHYMSDNTLINITSESVTLHDIVGMGSGNLSNIAITGNGATIMCNNTGGVYCESCSDVTIMGITWYQCGGKDPEHPTTQTPALQFNTVSNVTIRKCLFSSSSGCPVYMNYARKSITIEGTYFVDNAFDAFRAPYSCAGLFIFSVSNLNISIISSRFYGNGCRMSSTSNYCFHYGVIIILESYRELANIIINNTKFSNNSNGLRLDSGYTQSALVQLSHVNFYNNTVIGIYISLTETNVTKFISIAISISFVTFMNNMNPLIIVVPTQQTSVTININNLIVNGNIANNTAATKFGVLGISLMSVSTSVTIVNCQFYNNLNGAFGIHLAVSLAECESTYASITFTNVTIYNTTTTNYTNDTTYLYASIASVSIVTVNTIMANIKFTNVSFMSNSYSRHNGEMLLIENDNVCDSNKHSKVYVTLTNCTFANNTAFDHVVFLNFNTNANDKSDYQVDYTIELRKCKFDSNLGGESIVYILGPTSNSNNIFPEVRLDNSTFTNNKGTALYFTFKSFTFMDTIFFINNTANSGAAIYFEEVHNIWSEFSPDVWFINNSAVQSGGAVYFNLVADHCNMFSYPFDATFINNSANIAGNSIYFSIPEICHIITNISDKSSLLYVLNKFNYSQPLYTKSPPVVTSPCSIKFYPPAIAIHNSSNDYSIKESKMLGEPIQFNASVFDYFSNITESVIFIINCVTCDDDYVLSTYQITVHDQSLNELKIFPTVDSDVVGSKNILIMLLSVLSPIYKSLSASLSIELSPCNAGYLFDKSQRQCICYPHPDIVHCTEQYSEIKIGYWIGFLTEQLYTSSICPSNYCNFAKRTETSQGYYNLPSKSDDQCSSHRTGVACEECKPGYTLAYDSPDCINIDECSTGMTILVIVLTILYWIAIVTIVFGLMYFRFRIPLGYVYAIIYYYSIVDVLLINDVSEVTSQLLNILSSFARLTPQLFGQLCFVRGLRGIDQQFIHYFHALAVSLILLIIVLAAR